MVAEHLHAKSGWPSQSQKWFISKSLYIWAIHHKSTFLCKHSYRLVFDLVIAQSVDTSWENIVGIYMFASRPETLQEWISSINTLRKPLHGKLERWGRSVRMGNLSMFACYTVCSTISCTIMLSGSAVLVCYYITLHAFISRLSSLGVHIFYRSNARFQSICSPILLCSMESLDCCWDEKGFTMVHNCKGSH